MQTTFPEFICRLPWVIVAVAGCGAPAPLAPIEVQGIVLGGDGQPQEGALVSVGGRPAVTTDATGTFRAAQVQPPYEVTVGLSQPDLSRAFAAVWQGLRRQDPVLALATGWPQVGRSGAACGSVAGFTTQAQWANYALLQAPGASATAGIVQPDTTYCANASWFGGVQAQGVAHVLQVDFASAGSDRFARSFPGYGRSAGVTLADQQIAPHADVAVAPVPSGSLRVSTSLSTGLSATLSAAVFFGSTGGQAEGIPIASLASAPPWPDIAVPAIADATISAWVAGIGSAGTSITHRTFVGAASWQANLPLVPIVISPPDGASLAPASRFQWTAAGTSTVHVLEIAVEQTPTTPLTTVQVITAGTQTPFPDPGAVGVPLPSGVPAKWSVTDIGPVSSIDEFAALERVGMALRSGAGQTEMLMSKSPSRTATLTR